MTENRNVPDQDSTLRTISERNEGHDKGIDQDHISMLGTFYYNQVRVDQGIVKITKATDARNGLVSFCG